MRNMQVYFDQFIIPAQSATDNAVYHKALASTEAKVQLVPSGARYVVFSNSSTLSGDFSASFGTSLTATTTSVFPLADSTAATGTVINPGTRYLPPNITAIAVASADATAKVCMEFFS